MRFLILLAFLLPCLAHAQSGISASYIRMTPTALPALCHRGDVRIDSTNFYVQVCSSTNTWTTSFSSAPTTIGAIDGQAGVANGLTIVSNVLYAQSASSSNPGMVNNSAQTFSGAKTFSSTVVGNISGNAATVSTNANLTGDVTSVGNAATLAATSNTTLATLSGLTTASSLATVGTITSGTWSGTTVALNKGGTGQTTANAAFNALSPMTTGGDIIYGGASGVATRLANGSVGQALLSGGGTAAPVWTTIGAGTGTVTSAAITVPTGLSVSGSPITTSGTFAITGFINESVTAVKTNTYSILTTDSLVLVDGTTNAFTATLPTAVGVTGKKYTIKRVDMTLNKAVTVGTTSSQTIDGLTTRILGTQYEQVTVVSDGTNWQITAHDSNTLVNVYTPTLVGYGTVSGENCTWQRLGGSVRILCDWANGTVTGSTISIPLPTGMTSSTVLPAAYIIVGVSTSGGITAYLPAIIQGNQTAISIGANSGTTTTAITPQTGTASASSGSETSIEVLIPIDGWF